MNLSFKLAWTQTLSLWRSGALSVLVFSLVLAVTAISAIGFFTQRVETALNQQGGLLLGGDIAVISDHAIPYVFIKQAKQQNMALAKTYEFVSMVVFGNTNQLSEIKAVEQNFPLRGDLTIGKNISEFGHLLKASPNPGEAWLEPRLANFLNIKVGDEIEVGERKLRVSAILLREPSRGGDMFSFAPRLMMNATDLPYTKLIQYGSRVKYQLLLASSPQNINQYLVQAKQKLGRGEKIQDVRNARPEIKSALDKAQQFLGLSAMVSVILAMVAMLISSLPYIKQSLDMFALMRCFGASKSTVLQVLTIQTILIAFFSAMFGVLLGFIAQFGLGKLAGSLFLETLPPPSITPIFIGITTSIAMMFAVVVPHAWQMRNLTAMNILRRETLEQPISSQVKFLPATLVMSIMIFWQAGDVKLAGSTILALLFLCLAIVGFSYVFVVLANRLFTITTKFQVLNDIKLGLLGLKRRFGLSAVQMIGFSMGLMVLMLLALIRGDLIRNWQASLPVDAPNRFLINIQPTQIRSVNQFFERQNIKNGTVFPMVKARLISKNGSFVNTMRWESERARHLAEREFNLSWTAQMQSDNKLLTGSWWTSKDYGKPYLSLEQELAKTLGIQLGDKLLFDVAGIPLTLTVINLRKVEWDTMRVNFFAVTPPGVLNNYPANYISSFNLPISSEASINQLIRLNPNLTIIDVAALMEQVRGIMQKMSSTIEYVFAFSLIAGLAVLYATLIATREERIKEATLMRVFGSSRRQVGVAYVTEFSIIGLVSALIATIAANLLAYYVSAYVLNVPFQFNVLLALSTSLITAFIIPLVAWLGLRGFLNLPARQLLNSI